MTKYKMLFLLFPVIMACKNEAVSIGKEKSIQDIDAYLENSKDTTKPISYRKNELDKAYKLATSLGNYPTTLNRVSAKFYALGEYDKFNALNQKSIQVAKQIKDSFSMAKSYGFRGMYFRKTSLLDSAYKNFYTSDKIYSSFDRTRIHDPIRYAYDHGKVLIDLAKLSRAVKDYSESEDLTIRAIKKFKTSKDLSYLPLAYSNLGIIAKHLERYDDAVKYHLKAIDYANKTKKDTLYTTLSYNNIGTVYKTKGDYNKAKEYYKIALSYENFLKERPKRFARVLDNLAYVKFLSSPEDEEVLPLFKKSLKIRDSVNDLVGISSNAVHLAAYYQYKNQDSIARHYATLAMRSSKEVNHNVELLQSYQILAEASKSDKGLHYANEYIRLNDSLVKEERLFKNQFARIRYETEQIEKRNIQIRKENEILVITVLGITALFLMIYIIFRQQQNNKELLFAQQQQETNEEIYRLMLNQQVKLEEGRQMEQQRMSEELHDGVLGRLFGVRLSLDGINQRVSDGFTETRTKYIDELKSIEKEIRLISHDLGTETLSPEVAYVDAVESLISDLCAAHQMEFEFTNDENIDWEEIDDQKKVNIFRILQESMQNIFKHAKAEKLKISFDYLEDKIKLLILDDGIGFNSNKVKRGIGLKNITSRVNQMSGAVDFISEKDEGTAVSVSIPIQN